MSARFADADPAFMRQALASAAEGVRLGHGGPFGACVVRKGRAIAVAHNTVLRDRDPTAHAEMNALRAACRALGTHDLSSCVIDATAEPCPMCLGAIAWARLARGFYGVARQTAAAAGFDDARFHRGEGLPTLVGGLMEEDCAALFAEWQRLGRPLY